MKTFLFAFLAIAFAQDSEDCDDESGGAKETIQTVIFNILFGCIMVGMGTTISLEGLKKRLHPPTAVAIAWFHQFCILPFVAFCITEAFGFPSVYSVAIKLQTMCPGGNLSNILCFLGMADVPISIACTTLSSVSALFMMPIWILVYLPDEDSVKFGDVIKSIMISLGVVLAGTAIGMWLAVKNDDYAKKCQKITGPCLAVMIIIILVMMASGGVNPFNPDKAEAVIPGVFLVPVIALSSTLLWATLLGVPKPQRIAISLETSVQNQALALAIILMIFCGDDKNKASSIPILYGLAGAIVNVSMLIWAYYNGWTFADPNLTLMENFIAASEHMRNGTMPGEELPKDDEKEDETATIQVELGDDEDRRMPEDHAPAE